MNAYYKPLPQHPTPKSPRQILIMAYIHLAEAVRDLTRFPSQLPIDRSAIPSLPQAPTIRSKKPYNYTFKEQLYLNMLIGPK